MTTWKEACERISKWLKETYDVNIKPQDIFNISSTGELWPVVELFEKAKADGF